MTKIKETAPSVKLEAAVNAIAEFFYDPRRGRDGIYNGLAFTQDMMLGALPQQLEWSIRFNEGNPERMPKLREKVVAAMREDKGDELSGRNIAIATAAYKRLAEQIALERTALEVAKKVYRQHTGKDFQYRDFSKKGQDLVDTSNAREEARRLLGITENADASHNSK
jgi:hypothetical protein